MPRVSRSRTLAEATAMADFKTFRLSHQLSQATMGRLFGGLSPRTVSRIECGVVTLSPEGILLLWVLSNGGLPAVAGKMKVVIPAL